MSLRVSIIIPALDEAPGIGLAVDRAWATGAGEVIVVDGGSRDGTAELARAAGGAVIASVRGRGVQQNAGARQATGDVLLFLHADTWLDPDGLRQLDEALAAQRIACGAFSQRIEADGAAYRLIERGNAWRARWRGLPYGDQGIFVRRELFERLGGFPEAPLLEDLLFMKRLRRESRPVVLPGPLYVSPRRWQKHGLLRQTARNWLLLAAAGLGVSPARLACFYPPHSAE